MRSASMLLLRFTLIIDAYAFDGLMLPLFF